MNRKEPPSLGEAIQRILADPDTRVGRSVELPEPPIDPATDEAAFQARVKSFAGRHGWECYHTHNSKRSDPGFPDLVLARPPRILFRELKTETGKVSDDQKKWLLLLAACGLDAAVWRPSQWDEIQETLR